MAEAKVRCTTCYNVFNTSKKEGQGVTCPMCDSSFTVEKTTFVADIRQSITKVTKGISDYVKEKMPEFLWRSRVRSMIEN